MSFDTLSLSSSLPTSVNVDSVGIVEGLSLSYRDFDCGRRPFLKKESTRSSKECFFRVVFSGCDVHTIARLSGFKRLKVLRSHRLFGNCFVFHVLNLKDSKKGTDGFSTLQSNRIFPFTNAIFIFAKMGITHFSRIRQSM